MQLAQSGIMLPNWGASRPFSCPECGQDSFFNAIKCPKCDQTFISVDEQGLQTDVCPSCGFSQSEEKKKLRREQKAEEREGKYQRLEERKRDK